MKTIFFNMSSKCGVVLEWFGIKLWASNLEPWLLAVSVTLASCIFQFSSVQSSHSVMSDSLRPHESPHARPPCPSPIPGVHSNSCPSLLLGRKVITNLDSVLKIRDITLPTKVHLFKAMVFPVVMYTCERWTVKKAEHWRIDAFELWYRRRLLRVPWTARRSNQSILKEISPGCSLEGLKFQYVVSFMWRVDSLEKTLILGGIGGRRRRGHRGWDSWMASQT